MTDVSERTSSLAPKLADFHAFHEACGSTVEIKPARGEGDRGRHALHAWCPACGATAREQVDLVRLDNWLEKLYASAAGDREFALAIRQAREILLARSGQP